MGCQPPNSSKLSTGFEEKDILEGLDGYTRSIPDYGDVMTVEEFTTAVEAGGFVDYDGFGNPAKDGRMDGKLFIIPSRIDEVPKDCTHIVWYNR